MRNKTKFLCSALLGSFGFAWIHLESIGFDWSWSDSIEFAWIRWDFLRLLKDSSAILSAILEFFFGFAWIQLESIGFSWSRLDSVGVDRIQSLSLGFVEILRDYRRIHQPFYQDFSSLSWIRLDSIGFVEILCDCWRIPRPFYHSLLILWKILRTKQNRIFGIRSDSLGSARMAWDSSRLSAIGNVFCDNPATPPTSWSLFDISRHFRPLPIKHLQANLPIHFKPTQSRVRTRH